MDKYLEAIHNCICSICVDSSEAGNCTLSEKEFCAIELFAPKIVDVVHSTESEDIRDYHNKLKDVVCSDCKAHDDKENCYLRDDANCALDRYFPLIVDTIQKVDSGEA